MLRRVADNLFWLQAYCERAANMSRFLQGGINHLSGFLHDDMDYWRVLLVATGDERLYLKRYKKLEKQNIIKFFLFDKKYSNSIYSALLYAHDNANEIRGYVSADMWEQVNFMYQEFSRFKIKPSCVNPYRVLDFVIKQAHLLNALTDETLLHDKGWYFSRLGRYLERADKITRILDVQYNVLLAESESHNNIGHLQLSCAVLLDIVSGFEMYQKKYKALDAKQVYDFLLYNDSFPHSLYFCLQEVSNALVGLQQHSSKDDLSCQLNSKSFTLMQKKPVSSMDMHRYLDDLQQGINDLIGEIYKKYLTYL